VEEFLHTEPYPIVVKPVESAGSDGVKLCHSYEEATQHFDLLMHSQRKVGHRDGAAVLCQEFLRGTEYVVDTVSRDGIHKVVSEYMQQFIFLWISRIKWSSDEFFRSCSLFFCVK
jgi:biotin carboxylase